MIFKWFPWRFMVSRLARSQGFLDPLTLYARLQQFAQPSDVAEPVELLRAGAVFHARGLINSRVLQHNLDWVWPYWVERQFDPSDTAFLPRAFSLTHVNLTNRNWTAVGLPGRDVLPIVDPRGLLTPFWDGWSLDVWCMNEAGKVLLPSREKQAEQQQVMNENLLIRTSVGGSLMQLETDVSLKVHDEGDVVCLDATAILPDDGWLIVSLRPCNPEGVSFIDHVVLDDEHRQWTINDRDRVRFDQTVDEHHTSNYHGADVYVHLRDRIQGDECRCPVGLVTTAASFRVSGGIPRTVSIEIPVIPMSASSVNDERVRNQNWPQALHGRSRLDLPDERILSLYEAAVHTLVLCTPDDTYAGPYTYKRYWYRDAVFIGHGLLCAGLIDRVLHLVSRFPKRQSRAGYYHSQEGEWDANGEVLWLTDRLRQFSGKPLDPQMWPSLRAGADWIDRKRLPDFGDQAFEGLLPAGFSAEHLGHNDHYYWDNYWGVAGLNCAASLAESMDDQALASHYRQRASAFAAAIERSLQRLPKIAGMVAIPAAPTRRMDAGAIGSVATSYPLQLCDAHDKRLLGTLEFLLNYCFHHDGFFQDMIHSGVNAYLTLHVAQALLRANDRRYADLLREVIRLASSTGHWPEAVHPHTGGGCMGDGHHAWAAAEYIAMIRNCFVREEGEQLLIGSGILPEWLVPGKRISFGPAPTLFGPITVVIEPSIEDVPGCDISWEAVWHNEYSPPVEICLPNHQVINLDAGDSTQCVSCRRTGS